jgi:uncharacterized protein
MDMRQAGAPSSPGCIEPIHSTHRETTLTDTEILVEHKPSPAKLEVLGVEGWPLWRREPGTFPWRYTQPETCYILRGRFTVTPEGGTPDGASGGGT